MPAKLVISPTIVLGSTSVSGSGTAFITVTSSISAVLYRDTVSYQANISGNPSGYFQANASLDYNPGNPQGPLQGGVQSAGNWASLGSFSILTGSPSPVLLTYQQVGAPWIQFQFVCSTGSGVIDMRVAGKSLG